MKYYNILINAKVEIPHKEVVRDESPKRKDCNCFRVKMEKRNIHFTWTAKLLTVNVLYSKSRIAISLLCDRSLGSHLFSISAWRANYMQGIWGTQQRNRSLSRRAHAPEREREHLTITRIQSGKWQSLWEKERWSLVDFRGCYLFTHILRVSLIDSTDYHGVTFHNNLLSTKGLTKCAGYT